MEKEIGNVVKIEGDKADVLLHSREVCGHCGARFSCVAGSGVDRIMTVSNRLNASVGDKVEIEISEKTKVLSAFLLFFMPLLLIIVGYYLANIFSHSEESGILGAVIGFFLSGFILWIVNKIIVRDQRARPHMKRLIH
jgi:sigma-E factor negative regulatory protein RseC